MNTFSAKNCQNRNFCNLLSTSKMLRVFKCSLAARDEGRLLNFGIWVRCSSVTYQSGYAPSSRLADDPFWTQRSPRDL